MRIRTLAPVGTLLTPRRTFRHLAESPAGRGAAPVWTLGLCWAALSLTLGLDGQQPSGPVTPPFVAQSYYLWQAAFLPFLIFGLWRFLTWATALLAGVLTGAKPDPSDRRALANVLGYAYGVPLLVSLVLPDVLILWVWGFERLSSAMMYYIPVTLVWMLGLCTLGVRLVYGTGWVRALTAALGGLMAQALVGALWIR